MKGGKRTVAAVVVTYNRKALLFENIESLLKQTKKGMLDIIIVDNASTDGTKEAITGYIDRGDIIYRNTGANLGGAGGFQYGIKFAVEHGYDYMWVMDDDCMPEPEALEMLLAADEKLSGKYGWLCSKVLWKDKSICTMNVQRRKLTVNVRDFESETVPVVMASFVSLFIPGTVVKELGLPIKEFFIWTDDWEYTRRISRKYPCYLCNRSVVIHKSASNIGANIATDTVERLGRYKYLYRNDVVLYRREGVAGVGYEAVRLGGHMVRVLLKAKDHRMERLKCILSGTVRGFSFHPTVEYPLTDSDKKRKISPANNWGGLTCNNRIEALLCRGCAA